MDADPVVSTVICAAPEWPICVGWKAVFSLFSAYCAGSEDDTHGQVRVFAAASRTGVWAALQPGDGEGGQDGLGGQSDQGAGGEAGGGW
jgi:hypothetical protein